MKKLFAAILASAMLVTLLAGCGGDQPKATGSNDPVQSQTSQPSGQPYKLTVALTQPAEAYAAKVVTEGCEKITAASEGRLQFEIHYSGTLVAITDVIPSLSDGFADIGFVPGNFGTDYFPITSKLMSMPCMGFPSTEAAYNAYTTIRAEFPALDAEYEAHGIKNLGAYYMGRNDLYFNSASTSVKTPSDLKGLKIGVSSAFMTNYLKNIGATPVFITNADMYTSMDNGVVNGLVQHLALMNSTGTIDTVKSVTFIGDSGILRDLGIFAMNLDRYNSLPEDLQKLLSDGFVDICAETTVQDEIMRDRFLEKLESTGTVIVQLTEEEAQTWLEAAEEIHQDVVAELEGLGLPAQAIYDRIAQLNAGGN